MRSNKHANNDNDDDRKIIEDLTSKHKVTTEEYCEYLDDNFTMADIEALFSLLNIHHYFSKDKTISELCDVMKKQRPDLMRGYKLGILYSVAKMIITAGIGVATAVFAHKMGADPAVTSLIATVPNVVNRTIRIDNNISKMYAEEYIKEKKNSKKKK